MKKWVLVILLVLVIVGGWYRGKKFFEDSQIAEPKDNTPEVVVDLPKVIPAADPLILNWQPVTSGIAIKHVPYQFNDSQYGVQILQIDPTLVGISLAYDQQGKTIAQWSQMSPNAIVSNAGFFKEGNEPVGLLFINGTRKDAHRINQRGTGLLILEAGKVRIRDLGADPVDGSETFMNALQSYPLLIANGQIKVLEQAKNQDRRTAIGVDGDGKVYLATVEYAHLGLFQLAELLKNSDIQFTDVLNLDGGGSTGIAVPFEGIKRAINSQTTVPTVLIIQ